MGPRVQTSIHLVQDQDQLAWSCLLVLDHQPATEREAHRPQICCIRYRLMSMA